MGERVWLWQCRSLTRGNSIDHVRGQTGGTRMSHMILPLILGTGRARDGKDDELINRARQRAIELEEEAQLLDAPREFGMVEQRQVGTAEGFALCSAPGGHFLIEPLRVGR